ncbi:hypothetical protein SUNI508_01609 [Seiridium unicorne]|uniref:Uncharacterized protein n=1 Tax=Seiridium unicorne TaxID=138068 RepID=A0ABR2UTK0_9PEZI
MKPAHFSSILAALGTALAAAGSHPRAEAPEGLRKLPSAQGVVVNGEEAEASSQLKPIPGSAVEVASLEPLLPLSTSAVANTGLAIASTTATSASLAGAAGITSVAATALAITSLASPGTSTAARGFFTITSAANGAAAAASVSGLLDRTNTSTAITGLSSPVASSVQGFQTIVAASSASTSVLEPASISLAVSTSSALQALATSLSVSNATAALTPLGGSEAVTATATAVGVAGSGGALAPLPGSAFTTASIKPLSGAESVPSNGVELLVGTGSITTTSANAAAVTESSGTETGSITSLKPLGGSETATSLQALSSLTGVTEATATFATAGQTGRNATAGVSSATNGLNSATSSSVVAPNVAASMALPWTIIGGLAGLITSLML